MKIHLSWIHGTLNISMRFPNEYVILITTGAAVIMMIIIMNS